MRSVLLALILFFLTCSYSEAQRTAQIEILNANIFEGDESLGKNVSRLKGDVRFKHKNALMNCDSAYLYQNTNSLDAFGDIVIVKGDSIRMTGDLLKYNGNSSEAFMTGNVILSDRKMTLHSDNLTYNIDNEVCNYIDGGKIVDSENELTSNSGIYDSGSGNIYFRSSVVLKNNSYQLISDTLIYNSISNITYFHGPTWINSFDKDSSFIYCENGWYNTNSGKSYFGRNSYLKNGPRFIYADSLLYDKEKMEGEGFGNVLLKDTVEQLTISGDYGISNDINKTGFVTGNALLTKQFDNDTLFMHADTLYAAEDTVSKLKQWQAYHQVTFFKTDLQGKCDSIAFNESDSLMRLYDDPIIWSEENQLTADSVRFLIYDNEMKALQLKSNSFICSSEGEDRFNQVKGRSMYGDFIDNKLEYIFVSGNGQSIYYTRNSDEQLTGVNRADCSDMRIRISDNRIQEINLLYQPDATLYPLDELTTKELRLRGFKWRSIERPFSKEDVLGSHKL